MLDNLILQESHNSLLEIAELKLLETKPSSILGISISKAVLEAREIKNSVATTTES